MPEVVELREVTDRRDVIHRAVQRLAAGEWVVLPTEAGAVLAALALSATSSRIGGAERNDLALLLRTPDEVTDVIPGLSRVGRRFANRCWPGPLVLRSPASATNGFIAALPAETQQSLLSDGHLAVRVSSHPVLSEVAKLSRGPLLIREISTNDVAQAPAANASLVVREADSPATSAGTRLGLPEVPSIVQLHANGTWQATRIGATPENKLQVAACEVILFCCTGNTCRSPMAELLCRHFLAQRLGCSPDELTKRGFLIASAGLAADYGCPASREAIEAMRKRGLDLRSHTSQPLTDRLLGQMDRCYTMTNQHRNMILAERPDLADRVQVLATDGRDIRDPFGGDSAEYAACASSLENYVRSLVDQLEILPS
jgi:protein-tyrosine phosphatase